MSARRLAGLVAALAVLALPAPAAGAVQEKTVRYGPYVVPGMQMHTMVADHGSDLGGHHGAMRTVGEADVRRPCRRCALVGIRAELVDEAGEPVNYATGGMLHHVVIVNEGRRDLMCPGWADRFFASGNERTPVVLPRGYGYRVRRGDEWTMIADLMNMTAEPRSLALEVTYRFRRDVRRVRPVRPLWLDVDQCGDSEFEIRAGRTHTTRDFRSPIAGRLLAVGGHVHDTGIDIALRNRTTRETLCRSVAGYGTDPAYDGHVESMTGCIGRRLATIDRGDRLRIDASYDSPAPQDDVMGIMVAYLAPLDERRE